MTNEQYINCFILDKQTFMGLHYVLEVKLENITRCNQSLPELLKLKKCFLALPLFFFPAMGNAQGICLASVSKLLHQYLEAYLIDVPVFNQFP